jgi:hypothetical protein
MDERDAELVNLPLTIEEMDKLIVRVLEEQFKKDTVNIVDIDRAICRAVEAWHNIGNKNAD